ncbi:MAG: SIMPL domain-containing protein [Alistipes sp.]|nr:SIMPL domain-containing protein [Alistipes sp.]
MKKFFIVMAAVAMTFVAVEEASAQNLQVIPSVSVNGSAQIKVTPDVIYLTIKLDESDTKGKVTVEEQRKGMFSALKKCGIDIEKQLSVQGMSSSFYRKRGSLAATQYELKVGSADEARKVFEQLEKVGVVNVNISRATSSKLEEYRTEARQAAMRNAQMRASQLAEAVGQTIGACYEINDYTTNVEVSTRGRLLMKNAVMMDAAVTEEAEPEVDFEQIVINYNISAKFYLNTEKQ